MKKDKESIGSIYARTCKPQGKKGTRLPNDPYRSGQLEKEVVKECRDNLEKLGFTCIRIYIGGVFHGSGFGSNEAEGFPDQVAYSISKKIFFFYETKRNEGAYLSKSQENWLTIFKICGINATWNTSWPMLEKYLKENKFI